MARLKLQGAGHGNVPSGKRRRTLAPRRTRANAAVSEAEKRDRFWREKYGIAPKHPTTAKRALPVQVGTRAKP